MTVSLYKSEFDQPIPFNLCFCDQQSQSSNVEFTNPLDFQLYILASKRTKSYYIESKLVPLLNQHNLYKL